MYRYDYLIVGAGLYGAAFAHTATRLGKKCLVVDKRGHLGGNVYCENVDGINIHKYGAHIFHTSNDATWEFVNSLTPFNRFTNSPLANYHGKLYNLPFNMNTFHQMWGVTRPEEAKRIIDEQRQEALRRLRESGADEPRNLEEQALLLVGRDIYERLIREYTEKQWGRECSALPAFIIKRLPVRFAYDNNYFNDKHQGIPVGGYNRLIDTLLQGVETRVNCDFFAAKDELESLAKHTLFTGKIDEYYGYRFGKLQYRTVVFEEERLSETPNYQGNAVVNYTDSSVPYTRIIEHKHFEMFGDEVYRLPFTVISREYSKEWDNGMEPYYPVNDKKNNTLYSKYKELAGQETRVLFGGRLAEYKYYDMAPLIERALSQASAHSSQATAP